jgi:MFS family permease
VVSSAFLLGGLSTAVIASSVADKFGRRTALQSSSLLVFTGCMMLAMAPNLLWAVLARSVRMLSVSCGVADRWLSELSGSASEEDAVSLP